MSNSVDPDETAHYEPSHLDLRCLQNAILSPMAVKGLILFQGECTAAGIMLLLLQTEVNVTDVENIRKDMSKVHVKGSIFLKNRHFRRKV